MTKKKVIFCNLRNDLPQCRKDPPALYMAYGMGIMMDICKANYLDFDFFDTYVLSDGTKSFLEYYKEIKHNVLLFSGIVGNYTYSYFYNVFNAIKRINPKAVIILGGPITSIYPEILLKELPVDIIVIGEGEKAFNRLIKVRGLIDGNLDVSELENINGIGYKIKNDIFFNLYSPPLKSPLEEESTNPLFEHPKVDVLIKKYVERQIRMNRGFDLSASRGCFGNCTFCKKVFDKPIRYFSAEYIISIMEYVSKKYCIKRFNFMDENFIANRENFSKFLHLLEQKNLDVQWRIRSRADVIPYELIDRMEKLGLYSLMIGLESASQIVLDSYNKKLIIKKYKDKLRDIARRNLLFVSIILGSHFESHETIQENIDFIKYIGLTKEDITINFLSVVPGTNLFEDCLEKQIIKSKRDYLYNYVGDFRRIELNISRLTDQELYEGRDAIFYAAKSNNDLVLKTS